MYGVEYGVGLYMEPVFEGGMQNRPSVGTGWADPSGGGGRSGGVGLFVSERAYSSSGSFLGCGRQLRMEERKAGSEICRCPPMDFDSADFVLQKLSGGCIRRRM